MYQFDFSYWLSKDENPALSDLANKVFSSELGLVIKTCSDAGYHGVCKKVPGKGVYLRCHNLYLYVSVDEEFTWNFCNNQPIDEHQHWFVSIGDDDNPYDLEAPDGFEGADYQFLIDSFKIICEESNRFDALKRMELAFIECRNRYDQFFF